MTLHRRNRFPRRASRAEDIAAPLILMLAILAAWEIAVRVLAVPKFILPAPSAIVVEIFNSRGVIGAQLHVTIFEVLAGYALAVVVGFVLSLAIVYSNAFRRGVLPLRLYPSAC